MKFTVEFDFSVSKAAGDGEYRKTFLGRATHAYDKARQRVRGHGSKDRWGRYEGLPICSLEEWMQWTLNDPEYRRLHQAWVESGFDSHLQPTPDRRVSAEGYVPSNLVWREHHKNVGRLPMEDAA